MKAGIEAMTHLILDDLHRIEVEVMIHIKVHAIMKKVTTVKVTKEMINLEVSYHCLQKTNVSILTNQILYVVNSKIYPSHHARSLQQN